MRRIVTRFVTIIATESIVLAMAATACSSSGSAGSSSGGQGGSAATGGGGTAGTSMSWQQRCQTVVGHNASCGKSSADQAAVDSCVSTQSCVPSVWSQSVVDSIMSCLAKLACTSPDDDCISATQTLQTSIKQDLFAACQQKATACASFPGCLETTFLVSDTLAQKLRACLDQACDAAATCMTNEYTLALTAANCQGELPFGG